MIPTSPHILRQWRNPSPAVRLAPNLHELLDDSGVRRRHPIFKSQSSMQVSVLPRQFVVVELAYAVSEFLKLFEAHGLFTPVPSMASHRRIQTIQEVDAAAVLHNGSLPPLSPSVLLDPLQKVTW
jgi:hypothetical protein